VDWYNDHHQHFRVGFHTPANLHYGHAVGIAKERSLQPARKTPNTSAPPPTPKSSHSRVQRESTNPRKITEKLAA
jgi:hypothetical protein